jgi:Cft2 family RNA processing exonuclease
VKYNIIGSSSKGNCIIVEDILMLDIGCSYAKIEKYLKKIKLIFLSHAHKDHLLPATAKKIAYEHPTIKFLCGSEVVVEKLVKDSYVPMRNIFILKPNKWFNLGALKVKLEQLEHDTPNYAIKFEIKGKKGIYMVDTADTNGIVAKDYDLYLIEANYNELTLKEHINMCENAYELYYLNRVPLTHLSYEDANSFLIENMGKNSQYEYIHKSNYNFKEVNNDY